MAFIPARHGTKNTDRRPENNNGVSRVLHEERNVLHGRHADAIESIIHENGISGCSLRLVNRDELPFHRSSLAIIVVTSRKNVSSLGYACFTTACHQKSLSFLSFFFRFTFLCLFILFFFHFSFWCFKKIVHVPPTPSSTKLFSHGRNLYSVARSLIAGEFVESRTVSTSPRFTIRRESRR